MHTRHELDFPTSPTEIPIRALMTSDVLSVHADEPLHRAIRIMRLHDCGAVPVVDRDGRLIGIVTDRDAALTADEDGASPRAMRVSSAMTREPISLELDDTLSEALEVMRMRQVRRVPIVDGNGRLAGIVALSDVVTFVAGLRRRGADSTLSDALVETLAAIGERRPTNAALVVCSA